VSATGPLTVIGQLVPFARRRLVALYAASATLNMIAHFVVNPVLLRLTNNTTSRRRLLNVGMSMFTVGSVLQFAASLFDSTMGPLFQASRQRYMA
jgi:predicted MFS family arabinose efflux permease